MNRHMMAAMTLLCLSSTAMATSRGHGHVQLNGSIIDTPCAIATGDIDQSIDLSALSISDLIDKGHGPQVPFTVHLVNCVLNSGDTRSPGRWKDVHITFDGAPDGKNLFALQGSLSGEGVSIVDSTGAQALPGLPMAATAIIPGSMTLEYRMQLTGDHHPLRPGNFMTTLRYFMEYE